MSRPRTAVILQARTGSTRLPGKALATIGDLSVVERCLQRLKLARAGEVILATTRDAADDALAAVAARMRVRVFRGSSDDVLDRYVAAAESVDVDLVIRATGDNPAVDLDAPRRVRRALIETRADYACEDGLPLGAGVEAITTEALRRSAAAATSADDREHVTLYAKRRPGAFRIARLMVPEGLRRPDLRFTIDTSDDLDYMRRLFAGATSHEPGLAELIAAASRCPRSTAA
jgi:spore coat polysaccharide biosynthesis protein SpsF